jgi:23S rRNA (guanine745-N1)-methyltransferase
VAPDPVELLRCPVCGSGLRSLSSALRCSRGHAFDVARQGYASLLAGGARAPAGDSPEMVAAREEFLRAGHFDPIADALAEESARLAPDGAVLEVGAGTGFYLAQVLERLPGRRGLALEVSKPALRRAARAHERIYAVAGDAWGPLPFGDGAAALVLSVFAPRQPAEMARVLAPSGSLLLVTPTERHLAELVGPLGLLSVERGKDERLDEQLGPWFELAGKRRVEAKITLSHLDSERVVAMGPSARHAEPGALREAIAGLPDPVPVTTSVTIGHWRRRAPQDEPAA